MKVRTFLLISLGCISLFAAPRPADKPFDWSTDLKYPFLPRQEMTFVDGVVKNKDATALPDIDALYSNKVKVDGRLFTLPGEMCETLSACYKADLNNDGVPDYVFVSVKVWNGRFAGQSDVAAFVSDREKNYRMNVFEAMFLEAERENGRISLIKYDYSDDEITLIRQFYRFGPDGEIRLHSAEAFRFKY